MPYPTRARLWRPFLWAIGLLLALALVWPLVTPTYNRAATSGARHLVPDAVRIEVDNQEPGIITMDAPTLTTRRLRVQGFTFQAGMILVLALVLATPGMAFRRRLAWAIAALPLFLLLHAGLIALIGWSFLWSVQHPNLRLKLFEPTFVGLYVLLPAMLGATWCWLHWRPALGSSNRPSQRQRV